MTARTFSKRRLLIGACLPILAACSTPEPAGSSAFSHTQYVDTDIVHTSLDVTLADRTAVAELTVAPRQDARVAFEAVGLDVSSVTVAGEAVPFEKDQDGLLWIETDAETIAITYGFEEKRNGDGWLQSGSTLLWPYYCGNLFPCNSDPADGTTFSLDVHDASEPLVFADTVDLSSPSYVVAWAMGDYTEIDLGTTSHDTRISVWHLPETSEQAVAGTHNLVAAFDYFESTLGPYAFGDHAGSVEADWQGGAYGGMEHHPTWHVGTGSMDDATTHVHEAAHGWYGDGVRIACWEDFVLSEGTVSYITAKAIGAASGAAAEEAVWAHYDQRLTNAMYGGGRKVAWPEGCGGIDILDDGLFSGIPYMKGAFFYRALENRIGAEALMAALGDFYREHVGQAARMDQLLAAITEHTGYDPTSCAHAWLREESLPDSDSCE